MKFDEIFYLFSGEELALGDDDEEDDDEDDIFNNSTSGKMVFCYQNCSDLLWEKNCSSDREKLFWDH